MNLSPNFRGSSLNGEMEPSWLRRIVISRQIFQVWIQVLFSFLVWHFFFYISSWKQGIYFQLK